MPRLKRLKLWEKILFICINSLYWSIYHECFYIQSFLSYDYTFVLQRADKETVPQTQQVQTLTWRPEVCISSPHLTRWQKMNNPSDFSSELYMDIQYVQKQMHTCAHEHMHTGTHTHIHKIQKKINIHHQWCVLPERKIYKCISS